MREILFRGKRIANGEWVEGYYVHTRRHHCIITGCIDDGYVVHGHYANDVAMEVVDPATVGQYTGLTDKNGKKVFEGDIVRIDKNVKETFCVEDGEVKYGFGGFYVKDFKLLCSLNAIVSAEGVLRCEVIDNIHDHKLMAHAKLMDGINCRCAVYPVYDTSEEKE